MTEPRLLLPYLDMRLEVLLAILTLLWRVTTRLLLDLRAGRRDNPLERSGISRVFAVVCPPRLRVWRTMTVPVPLMQWTLTGVTLSGLSMGLIWNFHNMEEPVGIPSARCKTFSCINLWVDVGDLSGIPPAYLSPDAVAS